MSEIQTNPSDIRRFIRNLFEGRRRNFLLHNITIFTKTFSNKAIDESTMKLIV